MTAPTNGVEPDQIDETFVPRAGVHVAGVELDGEAVLYDEDRQTVHLLSPTATVVWNCFDGSGTVGEIAADIAAAYETDVAAVLDDVVRATRDLGRQNLLDGVNPEPESEVDEFTDATGRDDVRN